MQNQCFFFQEMVRHYQRKTHINVDLTKVKSACQEVNSGKISLRKAAKSYGIPFSTLRRHCRKLVKDPGNLGRYRPVFSEENEKKLKKHILEMQHRFYGLTQNDVKSLVFQLAETLKIPNPFNKEKKAAGKDWLSGFLKRNPEISTRQPEPTSIARAVGFNKPQVDHFFNILQEKLQSGEYGPSQIWNADESNVSAVHKPPKNSREKRSKTNRQAY